MRIQAVVDTAFFAALAAAAAACYTTTFYDIRTLTLKNEKVLRSCSDGKILHLWPCLFVIILTYTK